MLNKRNDCKVTLHIFPFQSLKTKIPNILQKYAKVSLKSVHMYGLHSTVLMTNYRQISLTNYYLGLGGPQNLNFLNFDHHIIIPVLRRQGCMKVGE